MNVVKPKYSGELQRAINNTIARCNAEPKTHGAKSTTIEGITVSPLIDFSDHKPEALDLTAPRGGFSASDKKAADLLTSELRCASQRYFHYHRPAGRLEEAERLRLVKGCKSPTRPLQPCDVAAKNAALYRYEQHLKQKGIELSLTRKTPEIATVVQEQSLCADKFLVDGAINYETGEILPPNQITAGRGAIVRLDYRDWSDEYRIRVEASCSPSSPPPQQGGERTTNGLTASGARKIIEAGAYVHAVRNGFKTFLTLTFNDDARAKIASGETTIGREVSRFFDAAKKIWQRGFVCDHQILKTENGFDCIGASEIVAGHDEPLDYIWTAEAPQNDKGEVNPHCHVLLRWHVEPYLFFDWAKRLEDVWGHGFAKLERIRDAKASTGYLLKALGYLTKGAVSEQGEIKGNRYGISKSSRAPAWEVLASFHAEHMASLIGEIKYKLEQRERPTVRELSQCYKAKEKQIAWVAKSDKIDKSKTANAVKKVKQIEARIKQLKSLLNTRKEKVRAFDYQITVKGKSAINDFLNWCVGVRGWSMATRSCDYIPTSKITINTAPIKAKFSRVRARYEQLQQWWQAKLKDAEPVFNDDSYIMQDYSDYSRWNYA